MDEDAARDDEYARAALQAARAGDPAAMIDALYRSEFLAGLKRQLAGQWHRLDDGDVDAVVAGSVDAVYDAVRTGRPVHDVFDYLYKTARNGAFDLNLARKIEVPVTPERRAAAEGGLATDSDDWSEAAALARKRAQEARRRTLLARLRGMIARLKPGNMQDVLGYIVGAFARDAHDVTAAEVGAALGLTPGNVRVLKTRGLDRLRAMAEEDGDFDLMPTEADLQLVDEAGNAADDD